ncbi:hypothetical protein L2E82_26185 [Cichorium intybus]|uniref:Uncharacterized protein n=1 Tax=Cichorium intybus TaxID=13427 RepID=A0ACB9E575_CICIN|nr:hypothetical protein L2E82_26185 [Cichorium intybus]
MASSYKKYEIQNRNPNPKTSVLLVIDMQNHFSAIAKPIIPSIAATIDICRRASIPVIFTRHCHKSPADHDMLGEWWGSDLIIDGTPDSELIPEIGRREEELVVEKNTYIGFRGTQLEERLKGMGVEEVIVTGVMTNLCCETTARETFVRGFRVFFSTVATATSSEEFHQATLMNMAYGFAYLVDCKTLRNASSFVDRSFLHGSTRPYSEVLKLTLATDAVMGTTGNAQTPRSGYVLLHHVMGETDGDRGIWS